MRMKVAIVGTAMVAALLIGLSIALVLPDERANVLALITAIPIGMYASYRIHRGEKK